MRSAVMKMAIPSEDMVFSHAPMKKLLPKAHLSLPPLTLKLLGTFMSSDPSQAPV